MGLYVILIHEYMGEDSIHFDCFGYISVTFDRTKTMKTMREMNRNVRIGKINKYEYNKMNVLISKDEFVDTSIL